MSTDVIVMQMQTGEGWVEIGRITDSDPPGTITDRSGNVSVLIMFGWILRASEASDLPSTPRPLVATVTSDLNELQGPYRLIRPEQATVLADLTEGPYERIVVMSSLQTVSVRWSLKS